MAVEERFMCALPILHHLMSVQHAKDSTPIDLHDMSFQSWKDTFIENTLIEFPLSFCFLFRDHFPSKDYWIMGAVHRLPLHMDRNLTHECTLVW